MPGLQPNSLPPAKKVKYACLDGSYMFVPIVVKNLGVPSALTRQLLSNLGSRLADISGESRETSYLFQRCSVLVQRFNAVQLPDRDFHIFIITII